MRSDPQCVRECTNTQHTPNSHLHPGNDACPFGFSCRPAQPESIWDTGRQNEPFGFYCQLFVKWQTLSRNSVAEQSIQSMFNRQVADGDVIGKAGSNEPGKQSHRAIIRGLLEALAPLTSWNTLEPPLSRCDFSLEAVTFLPIQSHKLNYWNVLPHERLTRCRAQNSTWNIIYSLRKSSELDVRLDFTGINGARQRWMSEIN